MRREWPEKGTLWVVIGMDSRPVHINGSRLLLAGLRTRGQLPDDARCVIALPTSALPVLPRDARWLSSASIYDVPVPVHDDPYFTKLVVLSEFIESGATDHDGILYLDYDHVCTGPLALPLRDEGRAFVSSEVSDAGVASLVGQYRHYNTSLLYSSRPTLRRVTRHWADAYHEIAPDTAWRHREEIAFSVAAQRAGTTLEPVAPSVQASWTVPKSGSALFHYGGPSHAAEHLKAWLNKISLPADAGPEEELAREAELREQIVQTSTGT